MFKSRPLTEPDTSFPTVSMELRPFKLSELKTPCPRLCVSTMETHPGIDRAKVATLTDFQNNEVTASNKFLTGARPQECRSLSMSDTVFALG